MAKSQAAVQAIARRVALAEAVEQAGEKLRGNALTMLLDDQCEFLRFPSQRYLHSALIVRELNCVREQVPDYLLKARQIQPCQRLVALLIEAHVELLGVYRLGQNGS
ncbi:hypothetical protein QTH97_34830 [Variovorax sp. J22R24]|nr:hypothetical protein [Variovorax sp. J22R24]MDM0110116.1 hypothetical protein [Variovorax sp. J22R24]